ncbi:3,4-dihydroxy-2-butanone-4-phosphate synthase [Nocardia sp. CA-120079]|uniref:3,4-dihydroxy-2-butanone-4-phosphate synthase n=1 Tax=Nocardia sp. CA-120079 TaxID=3239974 RepID=UPI003D971781
MAARYTGGLGQRTSIMLDASIFRTYPWGMAVRAIRSLTVGSEDLLAAALADFGRGRPVVIVAEDAPEWRAWIAVSADLADTHTVSFLVRHTSGFVQVALSPGAAERLNLPPMAGGFTADRPKFTVTVDAVSDTSTGISARDRARTIRTLAATESTAADFTRPGHIVPVVAHRDGLRGARTVIEAALELAAHSGRAAAVALAELVSVEDPRAMATAVEAQAFAANHCLQLLTIGEIVHAQRLSSDVRTVAARIPLLGGDFRAVGFTCGDGVEHLALVFGDVKGKARVIASVHHECVIGDVFGSLSCECRERLGAALRTVMDSGAGVVVYLRGSNASADNPASVLDRVVADGGRCVQSDHQTTTDPQTIAAVADILDGLAIRSIHLLPTSELTWFPEWVTRDTSRDLARPVVDAG